MRKLLRHARQAARDRAPSCCEGKRRWARPNWRRPSTLAAGEPPAPGHLQLPGMAEGADGAGTHGVRRGGAGAGRQVRAGSRWHPGAGAGGVPARPMQAALLQLLKTGRIQRFDSARILPPQGEDHRDQQRPAGAAGAGGDSVASCSMRCKGANSGCRACGSAAPICPASSASTWRCRASRGASSPPDALDCLLAYPGPATWGAAQRHRVCPAALQ